MNLSEVIESAAVKTLAAVDIPEGGSNQHEIGGVRSLREFFGTDSEVRAPIQWRYLSDEREPEEEEGRIELDEGEVTFYDSRAANPNRSSEWRLYYTGSFLSRAEPGDTLVLVRMRGGEIYGLLVEQGSAVERTVARLFSGIGTGQEGLRLISREELARDELGLPERLILEALGVDVVAEPAATDEEIVIERFGREFPVTRAMSALARELSEADPLESPDQALVRWLEREEELFRALERVIVAERLEQPFDDVDDFISYSLSVQNRRKSRMGHALQNQLRALFEANRLQFDPQATTEGTNTPDFLFPGAAAYHDAGFPDERLRMLGVKSTCKERWRQVLTEADRIEHKHLCTLEPGISEGQTNEMSRQHLTLVLPSALHGTYTAAQQGELLTLGQFIDEIRTLQS